MRGPPSFLSELKRRNVYKVAVAYAVVGWVIAQIATQIFPFLEIPNWIVRLVIVLIAIGFPIALVIAWAFEATPEGIKRTEVADAMPGVANRKKHAWIYIVMVGVAVSIAIFFIGRYTGQNAGGSARTEAATDSTIASAVSQKSIAVLPFENLSSDKENAFFAEGIQDEILTRLAKIGALKVISPTSTAHYASSPQNLPEIARQLGVANILEGTLQSAANSVHVNVQLIRAATDEHLWAESYNRKLDDIFAVEGEVAGAIAEQLNAKLSSSEKQQLAVKPTQNQVAYDAYLRGLAFHGRVDGLAANIFDSIQVFAEAVRLDPEFGLAWAQLSRQQAFAFVDFEATTERREAARHALELAEKLAPNRLETQLADGYYHYWVEQDFEKAKQRFEAVRRQYPNEHSAPEALAGIARREGEWQRSHELYAQAIELDPQNVFLLADATITEMAMRNVVSAEKLL